MRFLFVFLLFPFILFSESPLKESVSLFEKSLSVEGEQKKSLLKKSSFLLERHIKQEKILNPDAEFNLGTIHLYLENHGKAIFHLKQAHYMDANNQKIVTNLMKAVKLSGATVFTPSPSSFGETLLSYWKNSSTLFWQLSCLLLSILFLLRNIVLKKKFPAYIIGLIVISLFSIVAIARQQGAFIKPETVLMQAYNPKSGLSDRYPGVFEENLNSGSCGVIIREQSGWAEVQWHQGNRGWVPLDKLQKILH